MLYRGMNRTQLDAAYNNLAAVQSRAVDDLQMATVREQNGATTHKPEPNAPADQRTPGSRGMNTAYLTALSALAGSVVGGVTMGITTWMSLRELQAFAL